MPPTTLTVLVVTYNHARFIGAAIESVLAQETDFDFEIIVSEDCSTDGTRQIVRRFAEAHPDRIRLLLSERNLNDNTVVRRGLEAAAGQYVALLDGDDYWTSTNKLQIQVDFLERHPDCSACFHNVMVVYDDGGAESHPFHGHEPPGRISAAVPAPRTGIEEIVRANYVSTSSLVFRSNASRPLPGWFDGLAIGDWALNVVIAQHGALAYLDETLGVYRVHPGGIWTSGISLSRSLADVEAVVESYDALNEHLGFAFDAVLNEAVARLYEDGGMVLYRRGQYRAATTCAMSCLRRLPLADRVTRFKALAVLTLSVLNRLAGRTLSKPA